MNCTLLVCAAAGGIHAPQLADEAVGAGPGQGLLAETCVVVDADAGLSAVTAPPVPKARVVRAPTIASRTTRELVRVLISSTSHWCIAWRAALRLAYGEPRRPSLRPVIPRRRLLDSEVGEAGTSCRTRI